MRFFKLLLLSLFFLLSYGVISGSYATSIQDNFGSSFIINSEHFNIYFPKNTSIQEFVEKLNLPISDKILSHNYSQEDIIYDLAKNMDILYQRICDILDMQLFSLKVNIKVCRDFEHLSYVYKTIFEQEITQNIKSFYVYSLNTIYIIKDAFCIPILGHEIAHAIISNYFVVQPSFKIQEVLAGYVEYQLRKFYK